MHGKALLKSQIQNIPNLPGIYQMFDNDHKVIYIGKAKNLQNRLSQYILVLSPKNEAMMAAMRDFEYTITNSEVAALLLEGQLIKKFKPKFNILLKDDKSFPYIQLRLDHEYPQLLKYRGKDLSKGKLFGPFASVKQVEVTLAELQRIFKLRSCTDAYFASRARPCLQYQIQKCSAPCVAKISKQDYEETVSEVVEFFKGNNNLLQENLATKMEEMSSKMQFEEAAHLRDKIRALSYIQLKSQNSQNLGDTDIIAVANHGEEFALQLYIYRNSQPCGNHPYFPLHTQHEDSLSVLESFLLQIYQNKKPPKQILTNFEVRDKAVFIELFKEMYDITVTISTPKLGYKQKLVQEAEINANSALERHLKMSAKNLVALADVQKLFDLPKIPTRIEVYDNSHIQGSAAVGAMIVAGKDGFEKNEYRLFTIKDQDQHKLGGDDYAMLREVLTRKFTRLKTESHRRPDLMIIDGGKGHMSTVLGVMQKFDLDIPFVCMSKGPNRNSGEEQFHRPGHEAFTLDKHLPIMKYLQILRDEVHNFAIKGHRKKRSKALTVSSLDHIQGIGQVRRKALLNYFGSFKEVADALPEELAKVDGISRELATKIWKALSS